MKLENLTGIASGRTPLGTEYVIAELIANADPTPEQARMLSDERLCQIDQIRNEIRRRELITTGLMIHDLMTLAGVPFDPKQDLIRNEDGKPVIRGDRAWVNVSHSGEYAAGTVSKCRSTGIDLQKVRDIRIRPGTFFTEADLTACPDTESRIRLWTRKEALLKCIGTGWHLSKAGAIDVTGERAVTESGVYRFYTEKVLGDYIVTICEREEMSNT